MSPAAAARRGGTSAPVHSDGGPQGGFKAFVRDLADAGLTGSTGQSVARGGKPLVGEPVVDRVFKMLGAFDPDEGALSLARLSRRSGVPKSSALRIARRLCELGALERLDNGEFVVGLRLLEIASLAPRGHGLRAIALPHMQELHHATRQHVLLAVLDGDEAVLVERLSAHGAGKVLYHVGGRVPLHGTGVGMCLLAHSPPVFQEQFLAGDLTLRPENRRLDAGRLRERLAAVRRDGVAVVARPQPEAMTSVAAPVLGPGKQAIAAIAVLVPTAEANVAGLQGAVSAVCRSVSRAVRSGPVRPPG